MEPKAVPILFCRCKECNKVFTQHTQLAEHCRTVHGNAIKAYVCDGSNVEQGRPRKRGRQPAKPRLEFLMLFGNNFL